MESVKHFSTKNFDLIEIPNISYIVFMIILVHICSVTHMKIQWFQY